MRYLMALALAVAVSTPAVASMELSDKYECGDCHKMDVKPGATRKKKEGPSYKEIAQEYKGKKGVEKQLAENIRKGSKDVWAKKLGKKTEMDAEEDVSAKDADALVKWILSL